ncbi:hypothetical protein FB595_1461, partial [Sphingobium sp. AEW010]
HSGDDNTRTLIAHRASAYYSLGTTFINAPIISRHGRLCRGRAVFDRG